MSCERGAVLEEARRVINGERQDAYGRPEDAFSLVAAYWTTFLGSKREPGPNVSAGDVALMMTLFKLAREAHQHKRDNIVDAAGYLGLYGDMVGDAPPDAPETIRSCETCGHFRAGTNPYCAWLMSCVASGTKVLWTAKQGGGGE